MSNIQNWSTNAAKVYEKLIDKMDELYSVNDPDDVAYRDNSKCAELIDKFANKWLKDLPKTEKKQVKDAVSNIRVVYEKKRGNPLEVKLRNKSAQMNAKLDHAWSLLRKVVNQSPDLESGARAYFEQSDRESHALSELQAFTQEVGNHASHIVKQSADEAINSAKSTVLAIIKKGIADANAQMKIEDGPLPHEIATQQLLDEEDETKRRESENLDKKGKGKLNEDKPILPAQSLEKSILMQGKGKEAVAIEAPKPLPDSPGEVHSIPKMSKEFKNKERVFRWEDLANIHEDSYLKLSLQDLRFEQRKHMLFGVESLLSDEYENIYWLKTKRGPAFFILSTRNKDFDDGHPEKVLGMAYIGVDRNRVFHAYLEVPEDISELTYHNIVAGNIGKILEKDLMVNEDVVETSGTEADWQPVGRFGMDFSPEDGSVEFTYPSTGNRIKIYRFE